MPNRLPPGFDVIGKIQMELKQSGNLTTRQIILFFAAMVAFAAAMGIFESIFHNFLADIFDIAPDTRGELELPREFPGFMVVAMAGVLAVLPVTRLGAVGAILFAAGAVGLAFTRSSYYMMVAILMVASAGHHLLQPVQTSIALALSHKGNRGLRIGQTRAIGSIGTILGGGFVWLVFRSQPQYRLAFLCAAGISAVVAIVYSAMHIPHLHQPRARLVLKKKYSLYYVLEFLFGARKQIFLTFGPWVLVRIYSLEAGSIARLYIIAAVIGIGFKPLAGTLIDRLGERVIMVVDGLILALVCLGYGYAREMASAENAIIIASACFVADNLLFSLGAARPTYLSKLTNSAQEITSTLSMGLSINHIASMVLPVLAGLLWAEFGFETVFLAAAILAVSIAAISMLVPRKRALLAQAK